MSVINQQPTHRQTGFGLVELMIGLLVGMVVVAAAGSILTTTLTSSNDNIKMARLDQELRQVMTMVSRDLRRASAWDGAVDVARVSLSDPLTLSGNSGTVTLTSSKGNLDLIGIKAEGGTLVYYDGTTLYTGVVGAFTAGGESYSVVLTGTWPTETAALDGVQQGSWSILGPQPSITKNGNCMLFAYDTNASGTITPDGTTADPNEKFGYRYDATDQAVKIKTSGATTTTDCAATTFTGWENITDPDTTLITAFTITDNSPATISSYGFNVGVREYTIKITGKLKSDTSVVRTLNETIRVRNDELGI